MDTQITDDVILNEEVKAMDNSTTPSNGNKKTLVLLLEHSTHAMEQVAISQIKIADSILTNTSAITDNTKKVAEMTDALRDHMEESEKTGRSLEAMPSLIEDVVSEQLKTVPGNSWSWIWDRFIRIGSGLTGMGLLVAGAVILFKLFTKGL